MKEHISTIEALIEENRAIEQRTPFLDVALGGLRTALENCREHEKATAPKSAGGPAHSIPE